MPPLLNPSAHPLDEEIVQLLCPLIDRLSGLLQKIELFMGCSVGFKYAKNALAAKPRPPLGELTMLPQTSYSRADGWKGEARGNGLQTMDRKKIKTQLPH